MTNLSEYINEHFGANANYVEGLLAKYKADAKSVDESWQTFFGDLMNTASPLEQVSVTTITPISATVSPVSSDSTAVATAKEKAAIALGSDIEFKPIIGASKKIVENMEMSLGVPTATSTRRIPVKVLEENRKIINDFLAKTGRGKISFTHIIAWAMVKALDAFPRLNHGYAEINGSPSRLEHEAVNIGLAIDIEKKDGTRNLLVPSIKGSEKLNFAQFFAAYNEIVAKARDGKLTMQDFQGTTISLTNPGTLGTVASNPRLMSGQGVIIAAGAIEYPAEYQAMTAAALSQIGISKVMTMTSTYDHRIIQGAESGLLLAKIHEFLIGKHNFYDTIFKDLEINYPPLRLSEDHNPAIFGGGHVREQIEKQANVLQLINAYRIRGHLLADIDPLNMTSHHAAELDLDNFGLTIWDLDREFITGGLHGEKTATLRRILDILQKAYCGKVGIEYRHIQEKREKEWIREQIRQQFVDFVPLSAETKKALLNKLIEAEQFEQFLHKKYLGQKRFSLEGCETLIPMLDQLVEKSSANGVNEIYLGMAHRGRLNVLCNIVDLSMAERIFTIFEGTAHPSFPADEGDVKYHQGAIGQHKTLNGNDIRIQLACNPSHLEFVNPVVEGMVRAKQDELRNGQQRTREDVIDEVLPVLLHGDAAFAGQGTVMETLQLANLTGYRTGGTIHIVINNQIGFTTSPGESRSSIYSTDAAQITQTPIFHINGDDPEAAFRVIQISLAYRQEFNKDVVMDLVGFRKLGHNEGDEPSYTQPVMYAKVKNHPGVQHLYAQQLIREKVIDETSHKEMTDTVVAKYEDILKRVKQIVADKPVKAILHEPTVDEDGSNILDTSISNEVLRQVSDKISLVPEGFQINPKMVGQLAKRAKMGTGEVPMDWGFAEAIAFGSLVLEGTPVRLSGQDSGRGTFSHRHASMYDTFTGERWLPLSEIRNEANPKARFYVFDSSLSEQGVLGFEYGYSVISPDSLTIWEAQFGDFANGAQVIIDQYISSSEDKWKQRSPVVLLLPHGYEGQGPEHSSARLERFLQLCAENNLQVCNPTTPANYFHLLRRQTKQEIVRPLIVMTPKSLLRLPEASSTVADLTNSNSTSVGFQPVIDDANADVSKVKRIVVASGKVFYDLEKAKNENVAVVRLEQFYPFPKAKLQEVFAKYKNAESLVWCQEEPRNMGGWVFVRPRLDEIKGNLSFEFVGRVASASPATGSYAIHNLEQAKLVGEALTV